MTSSLESALLIPRRLAHSLDLSYLGSAFSNDQLGRTTRVDTLATPAPGEGASDVEKQLFAIQQQLNRLSQAQCQQEQATPVAQPTASTARVETKMSARRMNALRWLETCVDVIKDHNIKADGDTWQMWALPPGCSRMYPR